MSGSVSAGGKIIACPVWLLGSPTVAQWSKGMCNGRAKAVKGCEVTLGQYIRLTWDLLQSRDCSRFRSYF